MAGCGGPGAGLDTPCGHPHHAVWSWQADRVPQIDLVEETFVAADPALVRPRVATPGFLQGLWPRLRLRVSQDRGGEGLRFSVSGPVTGTAEVWLEGWADGVIVHVYLRVDPSGERWSASRARRERHRLRAVVPPALWEVKDVLEAGRRPGDPARR